MIMKSFECLEKLLLDHISSSESSRCAFGAYHAHGRAMFEPGFGDGDSYYELFLSRLALSMQCPASTMPRTWSL